MAFRSWRLPSLLLFTLTACSSIPEIEFGSDDAASTGKDAADDALDATARPDGGDSGADGGGLFCPDTPPPGADVCCNTVACVGNKPKCEGECTNCFNNCRDKGGVCCLDSNGNYKDCALAPALCPH